MFTFEIKCSTYLYELRNCNYLPNLDHLLFLPLRHRNNKNTHLSETFNYLYKSMIPNVQ